METEKGCFRLFSQVGTGGTFTAKVGHHPITLRLQDLPNLVPRLSIVLSGLVTAIPAEIDPLGSVPAD